jgi:hypothetical protein
MLLPYTSDFKYCGWNLLFSRRILSFFLFLYSSQILSFFACVVKNELGKKGEPILSYIISFQVLYYFGWGGENEIHSEVVCGASRDE